MATTDIPRGLPRRAIALILAGGRGSRLKMLTDKRAKPAVYFGGKFRIIDFALSNCVNSGFRRIGVVTQYKSHSLLRHLQRGWSFMRGQMNEFIDLLPAQQRLDEENWYRGTADAVYQNIDILRSYRPEYILILAGDHIYKQDYSIMLDDHVRSGANVTVGCVEVPRMEATGFGVMHTDADRNVIAFVEKPKDPPAMPGRPDVALASMGIYIVSADFLYDELKRDAENPESQHDFGHNLLPNWVNDPNCRVIAHSLTDSCVYGDPDKKAEPYWRDVGTIDAFWEANIDLTNIEPDLNLYDINWPIWTYQEQLPPAKFVHDEDGRRGHAINSLVSGGCIISGAKVSRSVLFSKVLCRSYSELHEAVVMPEVVIGRSAKLKRVVIDKGVQIPEGMVIGEDAELDAKRFYRTDNGIVLVTRDMLDKL